MMGLDMLKNAFRRYMDISDRGHFGPDHFGPYVWTLRTLFLVISDLMPGHFGP